MHSHVQTPDVFCDVRPTLTQHWINIWCLLCSLYIYYYILLYIIYYLLKWSIQANKRQLIEPRLVSCLFCDAGPALNQIGSISRAGGVVVSWPYPFTLYSPGYQFYTSVILPMKPQLIISTYRISGFSARGPALDVRI